MAKGKFGDFRPKNLGAEPAEVPPPMREATASPGIPDAANLAALRSLKVPFASRITIAADQQLKALAKQGHTQVDLLAQAMNLLFKKYKLPEVA